MADGTVECLECGVMVYPEELMICSRCDTNICESCAVHDDDKGDYICRDCAAGKEG